MNKKINRVHTMLNGLQNLKYKLIFDSLLVGIAVGLVIVIHRTILLTISPIFINFYEKNGSVCLLHKKCPVCAY